MLRLADVIVTAAPLAFNVPLSVALDPTATLPKLRFVGDTANCPAAVPVPESAIVSGEFDAFDPSERLPLAAPLLVGVNVTLNVALWFGVRVSGKFNPLIEKAAAVELACEIVTAAPPVLVSVSVKLELLPS